MTDRAQSNVGFAPEATIPQMARWASTKKRLWSHRMSDFAESGTTGQFHARGQTDSVMTNRNWDVPESLFRTAADVLAAGTQFRKYRINGIAASQPEGRQS